MSNIEWTHIDFNNPPTDENWVIPYEVYEYYIKHDYLKRGIALNLELAKEIFEILKSRQEA